MTHTPQVWGAVLPDPSMACKLPLKHDTGDVYYAWQQACLQVQHIETWHTIAAHVAALAAHILIAAATEGRVTFACGSRHIGAQYPNLPSQVTLQGGRTISCTIEEVMSLGYL